MSHEWLTTNNAEEPLELKPLKMPKDPKPVLQVDPQDSNQNIITSLNKIIKQKDEEINRIRQENEDLRKGKNQSPESNAMMKEIRKLRGLSKNTHNCSKIMINCGVKARRKTKMLLN